MLSVSQETIGQGFRLAGGTLVKVGTTEINPTASDYAEAISALNVPDRNVTQLSPPLADTVLLLPLFIMVIRRADCSGGFFQGYTASV